MKRVGLSFPSLSDVNVTPQPPSSIPAAVVIFWTRLTATDTRTVIYLRHQIMKA